ncbi:MAG: MBL fold metallo-hydrolase [Parabacteroides sp.]|nr:MBL fold metallo-hydrolase [Parabacteroides sp.]
MDIQFIETGFFYADGGAMFGAIPKTAWSRRYQSNEQNGCILAMRCAVVRCDNGRTLLIDNGAGDKQLQQLSYYRFFDLVDLKEELLKRGISPEEITDVVLTHLHFDHCGYTTQKQTDSTGKVTYTVAFPNAKHWVSREQWENFLHPNALEKESYYMENMQAVAANGLLHLIEQDTVLCPEVELRLYGGHTPGQIAPYIQTDEGTYVFAGDVIPLAASVSPVWISAYDTYPVTSYQEKLRLLEEAAREQQTLIFCHDAYTPIGQVKKVKDFYTLKQIRM